MTPQEAVHLFYLMLSRHFHHGYEQGLLDAEFKAMVKVINSPSMDGGMAESMIGKLLAISDGGENGYIHFPDIVAVIRQHQGEQARLSKPEKPHPWIGPTHFKIPEALPSAAERIQDHDASEMRLVDVDKFWTAYFDETRLTCPEHDRPCTDVFRDAMEKDIRPHIRSPEPVSVDLAVGAEAIEKSLLRNNARLGTMHLPEAKACAEAWGFKWK